MSAKRHFDAVTLRSFVTIVDLGSMTAAAKKLHLTQSAISMQIKRLEEGLGMPVFERIARGLSPTKNGEQLFHYAQKILALNDEAWGRLTAPDYAGQVSLGVPVDLVDPLIPQVLRAFNRDCPRARVKLRCFNSRTLMELYDGGELDIVLTTQRKPRVDADVLRWEALKWTGARAGEVWRQRPLPLAFCSNCAFRGDVIDALQAVSIDWIDTTEADDEIAIYASIDADLAVGADMELAELRGREVIEHGGELPQLPQYAVALYVRERNDDNLVAALGTALREAFLAG